MSSFFRFWGNLLYNAMPIFTPLFFAKFVLHVKGCRSVLWCVSCSCKSRLYSSLPWYDDSWLTIIRQISAVNSLVFHPVLNTAGTCAEISLHMTKQTNNVCSHTVPLSEKFNHSMLMKENVTGRQFVVMILLVCLGMPLYFRLEIRDDTNSHIIPSLQ